MKTKPANGQAGFSFIELLLAMTIMLVLMGIISTLIGRAMSVRIRETQKSDALVSAQAALSIISREVANSGFGIYDDAVTKGANNGLILADTTTSQIHLRTNMFNAGERSDTATTLQTAQDGEDVTYFLDNATKSIVRYDKNADDPKTSVVVNRISSLTFKYFNYNAVNSTFVESDTPSATTGRVKITVQVELDPITGQPNPANVSFTSEVTLRNSSYMLQQY
jgi:prepilin-type N-terminal cleavage/methylation domain-containing protein